MSDDRPATIGRYEILALLAQGGMARIYLATCRGATDVPPLVVIKQIRPELAAQRELREMFQDEARIAARLDHPNVVRTYELIEQDGKYAMVMEYLEGQTLAETLSRVGRTHFPFEEHVWVLTRMLAGLHYGHELRDHDGSLLGVVHQDVSPSNVFLTYDGEVKLLDFGIARADGALAATHKGASKGKLGYAAPEQFLSRKVDARADVYAAGVMLWEAIAGRRRSNNETPTSTRDARLAGLETKVREVRPDVPAELADLVERATLVDARARFRTAAELQGELERYLRDRSRQVSQRELAALMWVHFRSDRLQMRAHVEERLIGIAPPPSLDAPPEDPSLSLSSPLLPTLRMSPQRTLVAASVIAAAGMAGVVVGLIRGPSRTEAPPPHAGPPPVHSVVLERPNPPRPRVEKVLPPRPRLEPLDRPRAAFERVAPPRPLALPEPPPLALHEGARTVPLPLAEERARLRPVRTARLTDRTMVPVSLPAPEESPATPPPERRRAVEPGMDLSRPLRPASQRQLDEKDPYGP
jgi:serine/threonine protein kinase